MRNKLQPWLIISTVIWWSFYTLMSHLFHCSSGHTERESKRSRTRLIIFLCVYLLIIVFKGWDPLDLGLCFSVFSCISEQCQPTLICQKVCNSHKTIHHANVSCHLGPWNLILSVTSPPRIDRFNHPVNYDLCFNDTGRFLKNHAWQLDYHHHSENTLFRLPQYCWFFQPVIAKQRWSLSSFSTHIDLKVFAFHYKQEI